MPSYKYRVIFEDGKVGHGKIMALNKSHAMESLKKDRIQPISIKKLPEKRQKYKRLDYNKIEKENLIKRVNSNLNNSKKKVDLKKITLEELKQIKLHPFTRITSKDIIVLVNNLYILKKAKFNNIQALRIIYEQMENLKLKDILEDIIIGVESGEKMNVVMQNYPNVFPAMFVNFIKVGEDSGNLDTALLYARDYMEASNNLKKQVRSTVIPKVLQFFTIIILMFGLVIVGVPIIQDVYDMFDSTSKIPKATMITLDIANWFMKYWYIPTSIVAILVGIFFFVINTPKGRYNWDKFKLTCPVVGTLINNITVHKFFQAMLLNLKNGMRIQESLEVSRNVTSNYYFLSAIELAKVNVIAGTSWITPFEEKKLFKPMVSQMVGVGMQTELSTMMEKVNEYIQSEVDESLERFKKVLPEVTYSFVGIALIAFTIVILVPLVIVYMGGFIDMP
jgi:type II secretory pathway component PulF